MKTGASFSTTASKSERSPRIIGSIPDELKNQIYQDSKGSPVNYDHAARLKELISLEDLGKELYLIIGRGNLEAAKREPVDTDNGKRVWVYGEVDKSKQASDGAPHLFMDFDNEKFLKTIPDDLFAAVTFDGSVTNHFSHMASSVKEFKRIIKPGGNLYIDLGLTGYVAAPPKQFEALCKNKAIDSTSSGLRYCLSTWEAGSIIYEYTKVARETDEKEMEANRVNNIKNYLATVFGPKACEQKNTGYPVFENRLNEYFECMKDGG